MMIKEEEIQFFYINRFYARDNSPLILLLIFSG